jgi:membrane protease YdiL (CAAX protease family)
VFSALPGHVVQMRAAASVVSFASLAVVLGWVVLRTGAIWPAIVAHAVLNLTTITVFTIDAPSGLRLGLAAGTLVALVVGADVAGRRSGRLRPVPSLIDLTAV